MTSVETAQIPNRSLFRQPEVCELAQVQPYVLRSWEAEFPDLGVAKTKDGPRVYRKADVERVLRIKHLLFVEGLTLAGARRKLLEEQGGTTSTSEPAIDDLLSSDARERIRQVRKSLRELAAILAAKPGTYDTEFTLASPSPARPARRAAAAPAKVAKGKKKK